MTCHAHTGGTGPQIVSGAATADSGPALESLAELADTRASVLLPGHGDPWLTGGGAAAIMARAAGPS